jgi:hypothetical protein
MFRNLQKLNTSPGGKREKLACDSIEDSLMQPNGDSVEVSMECPMTKTMQVLKGLRQSSVGQSRYLKELRTSQTKPKHHTNSTIGDVLFPESGSRECTIASTQSMAVPLTIGTLESRYKQESIQFS